MKKITVKLDVYKKVVEFLNNYFSDKFFMNEVEAAGVVKLFTDAEYDTISQCANYIDLWFDVFEKSCDVEFWDTYNDFVYKLVEKKITKSGEYYIPGLNTTIIGITN